MRLTTTLLPVPLVVHGSLGQDEHPAGSFVPKAPTSGMVNPLTTEFTALLNTAPMTNATARPIRFPRMTNSWRPVGSFRPSRGCTEVLRPCGRRGRTMESATEGIPVRSCPIVFHEGVIQHSATPRGDVAAAPESAAAVWRGTDSTTRAPPGPPTSVATGFAWDGAVFGLVGRATTVTPVATTRAPASTSTREPGRSRATAAASAIRTGARTRRSPGLAWCTAPGAGPRGAAGTCRGVAL